MAAFTAAFLDNPFQAQVTGGTTTDTYGNILNAAGRQVGVVPGSVADVGTKGMTNTAVTPAGTMLGTFPAPDSATSAGATSDGQSSIWSKLLGYASKATGLSAMEDILFVVVGMVMITASVFSLAFASKTIRSTAVKAGKAAIEVATA